MVESTIASKTFDAEASGAQCDAWLRPLLALRRKQRAARLDQATRLKRSFDFVPTTGLAPSVFPLAYSRNDHQKHAGHREDALDVCRRLAQRGLSTAQTKSIEAMVLESMEPPDVEGAVTDWREAMDLAPDDWASANNLGNLLMRWEEGNADERLTAASEILEEALRRAPSRVEPLLNLALVTARRGDKAKAQALAKDVIKKAPPGEKELREQAERLIKTLG